ncbi:MAG TPA: DUF481 domain-containing protein [Oscillatoriaceae cyanobacterium M33_DOE_052]|uniref:DUF481 domain-containing protein n=1 Tax=Planktothricoides sp. SpSt-374 TaxID=2282167 RepID=A0A7C3VJ80_9CYAN|nr:DUF481 domain-containing protein [Oscillatoriaceae cyanobacterium M33_DOE_052]
MKTAHIILLAPLWLLKPVLAQEKPAELIFAPICGDCVESDNSGDLVELNQAESRVVDLSQIPAPEAEGILRRSLQLADTITNPHQKARLLAQIASQYGKIGQRMPALEILARAVEAANQIDNSLDKAEIFSQIAQEYYRLGDREQAANLFAATVEAANGIEDAALRGSLLAEIALKYTEMGEYNAAEALLSQSQEAITTAAAPPPPPVLFPFQPIPWTGTIGLGSYFFSGTKTTSIIALDADIERKWPRDQIDIFLRLTNDFDDSRQAPDEEVEFEGRFETEYRHHITSRWQYFVNYAARRDTLEDMNVRTNLYTGPGINLWRAPNSRTLDMQLGLGARYEDSSTRNNDFDVPVAQFRLRYKDIYFKNLKLRQFFTLELPFNDPNDYYIESNTSLSIPITNGWSFNNAVRFRYSAIPTLDNPNVRVNWQTGIEYNF